VKLVSGVRTGVFLTYILLTPFLALEGRHRLAHSDTPTGPPVQEDDARGPSLRTSGPEIAPKALGLDGDSGLGGPSGDLGLPGEKPLHASLQLLREKVTSFLGKLFHNAFEVERGFR
jgi:hypothetical protein